MNKKMNRKGLALWVTILLICLGIVAIIGVYFGAIAYLAAITPGLPRVENDGEFDDAYLAEKGFYSVYTEGTDCNVTSDVLGASSYYSCIFDTTDDIGGNRNSTELRFDLVLDIDGDVENMEVDAALQNTGTGQAKDDIDIKEAELWTYDSADETIQICGKGLACELFIDNEDGEIEGDTGILSGDDYVLHIILKTKILAPVFANGNDIMRIDLDLTTDGDTDAARITLEE